MHDVTRQVTLHLALVLSANVSCVILTRRQLLANVSQALVMTGSTSFNQLVSEPLGLSIAAHLKPSQQTPHQYATRNWKLSPRSPEQQQDISPDFLYEVS
jgi:hypothetical protein